MLGFKLVLFGFECIFPQSCVWISSSFCGIPGSGASAAQLVGDGWTWNTLIAWGRRHGKCSSRWYGLYSHPWMCARWRLGELRKIVYIISLCCRNCVAMFYMSSFPGRPLCTCTLSIYPTEIGECDASHSNLSISLNDLTVIWTCTLRLVRYMVSRFRAKFSVAITNQMPSRRVLLHNTMKSLSWWWSIFEVYFMASLDRNDDGPNDSKLQFIVSRDLLGPVFRLAGYRLDMKLDCSWTLHSFDNFCTKRCHVALSTITSAAGQCESDLDTWGQ